ncbi:MAG: acetate--CoA ligase [Hyphomicrobiales bacterium]
MTRKITTLGGYFHEYEKSISNPSMFWNDNAESFYWRKKWKQTLDWDIEQARIKWFVDGKLNITENIFERQLFTRKDQPAIIWESNNPEEPNKSFTYKKLYKETCKFANILRQMGIRKGDRVAIYLPMIPELVISMLACARIGAIHSVIFAGFSSRSISDRIQDAEAKLVITADGGYRGTKTIPLKEYVDNALETCPSVEKLILIERTGEKVNLKKGRDYLYSNLRQNIPGENHAEEMDSEDPLFILYTSGSTGKPKGILHTCGGYMVYTAYTFSNVFQYSEGDTFFCTADIGWITGHSYIVYGPLLNGATVLMYEGIPTYPTPSRFWEIIEKHKVNQFYTAPTAIRALMSLGLKHLDGKDISTLKVLGTVGEPINESAWHWYHTNVGKNKCPIVDTWWQTETGGVSISPLASITPTKPSYATLPIPGIQPTLIDSDGKEIVGKSKKGLLCIKYPWPGIARTIWKDHERYKETYFKFKNLYFTGDGAKRDEEGYYRIIGRIDDVINVSGHRLGTAEIENAINENHIISESAVIGYPHEIKGEGICAFVVVQQGYNINKDDLIQNIIVSVSNIIGPIAKPDKVYVVNELPKTRSGKIVRRILKLIVKGEKENFGDISTLVNPKIITELLNIIE